VVLHNDFLSPIDPDPSWDLLLVIVAEALRLTLISLFENAYFSFFYHELPFPVLLVVDRFSLSLPGFGIHSSNAARPKWREYLFEVH
jgi:hypothetical protein